MSPRRKPEPWRETLEIENPLATCGGCRFTTALGGTWSVEDGRLVFRAMLNPLARRGPSVDGCCEGHHEGVESGALEFKRVTVDGKPLSDEQFAILKASAETPEAMGGGDGAVSEIPPPPDGPTMAELDALSRALRGTGWILALYPAAGGIGPPTLAREGIWGRYP